MNNDLKFYIRSLSRFIYVVTEEEDRFLVQLSELLAKVKKRIQVYNQAFGLVNLETLLEDWRNRAHKETNMSIHDALIQIYKDDPKAEQNFYVITDPDRYLKDDMVVRRVLNLAHQLHMNEKIVKITFFVGPRLVIPPKLQRYIEVVHDTGLSMDEIRSNLEEIGGKLQIAVTDNLVRAFKGLTSYELDAAVSQSIITNRKTNPQQKIDPRFIAEYKRRQLKKTDLVNHVDVSDDGFDKVGGLDRFKLWAEKNKATWTEEGRKFGLKPPKGVLLVGVWGCGKSISVKALGNAWRLPVVQLEFGKLRQSGVGDSEANVYRAISLIESQAPCLVWIDEAEKSLAGGQSSGTSDAGTQSRMIGILSTWLQENKADVCLAMTANSLKNLPIEFVRRTDERFFFDLPTEEERIDVLKIHLKRWNRDPSKYNLQELAEAANLLVSSEIEQALRAAMTSSFSAGKEDLDQEILLTELKHKPRIFRTLVDELREVVDWVGYDSTTDDGIRARFASSKRGAAFQLAAKGTPLNGG